MIATLFEWQVKRGREEEFRHAWSAVTQRLTALGSLGSALFRSADGHFHGHARWPDRATRDAAFSAFTADEETQRMRDCIDETIRRIDVDEIENFWLF